MILDTDATITISCAWYVKTIGNGEFAKRFTFKEKRINILIINCHCVNKKCYPFSRVKSCAEGANDLLTLSE